MSTKSPHDEMFLDREIETLRDENARLRTSLAAAREVISQLTSIKHKMREELIRETLISRHEIWTAIDVEVE